MHTHLVMPRPQTIDPVTASWRARSGGFRPGFRTYVSSSLVGGRVDLLKARQSSTVAVCDTLFFYLQQLKLTNFQYIYSTID